MKFESNKEGKNELENLKSYRANLLNFQSQGHFNSNNFENNITGSLHPPELREAIITSEFNNFDNVNHAKSNIDKTDNSLEIFKEKSKKTLNNIPNNKHLNVSNNHIIKETSISNNVSGGIIMSTYHNDSAEKDKNSVSRNLFSDPKTRDKMFFINSENKNIQIETDNCRDEDTIEDQDPEGVNDERNSTINDLNESIVSSNVMTHIYTPKMIQNIKTETQSFMSGYESISRIDTQNNLLIQSFSNDLGSNNTGSNYESEMDMQNPVRVIYFNFNCRICIDLILKHLNQVIINFITLLIIIILLLLIQVVVQLM